MNEAATSPLRAWALRGTTQPIARPVPADDERFLASKGTLKIAFQVAKRHLEFLASGQRPLLAERIDPYWKRAVWFHSEAPQIGDALMDLAPRSLLAEHGVTLDIVAPPSIAAAFRGDRWLGRVFDDANRIVAADYDFAIIDKLSWRALAAKRKLAPRLPWVTILGAYLAYDFQRASLATRRLAALLDVELDPIAEGRHSRQKLDFAASTPTLRDDPPRICLAVGGVRAERTYGQWPAVARALRAAGHARFALVGSGNGSAMAAEVKQALTGADVLDQVAVTDLPGTQQTMARCVLVVCADGGLLHLACTTTTPVVALFDASVDPAWRLPEGFDGVALRAPARNVNLIAPESVADAAAKLLE